MTFFPNISSFLLLSIVLACAAADDLGALKATLKKLCDANKEGPFASCCNSNNNGQDITSVSGLPSCLGSIDAPSSGIIQQLFVYNVVRFICTSLGNILHHTKQGPDINPSRRVL